jgi:choline kinase
MVHFKIMDNSLVSKPNTINYKVLITTSGIGSRVGVSTNFTNKCLLNLGDKPIISHIIEKYPQNVEFVITLGHFGDLVRDFLEIAYPQRVFNFVVVDNYKGKGSSLAYSISCAESLLQCPFIFHASDSIVSSEIIPEPKVDWVGGAKTIGADNYQSFDMFSGKVSNFHAKGMTEYDFVHIGIIGISNYRLFWQSLKECLQEDPNNDNLNDVSVIENMMNNIDTKFSLVEFTSWFDTGNSESLSLARKNLMHNFSILSKKDEAIYFLDSRVIKFFSDELIVKNRLQRSKNLTPLTPNITESRKNFYVYNFVPGNNLTSILDPNLMKNLLSWAEEKLWVRSNTLTDLQFHEICTKFYIAKTNERVNDYLRTRKIDSGPTRINGLDIPSLSEILDAVFPLVIKKNIQANFHGDFILENIIQESEKSFKLIDCRQDFGGETRVGDMYYDLAKLNHSLYINNEVVLSNNFFSKPQGTGSKCGILRRDDFVAMEKVLEVFIADSGFDLKKVKLLMALIWLNMSPLHVHPFDQFLFDYGRFSLWKTFNDV